MAGDVELVATHIRGHVTMRLEDILLKWTDQYLNATIQTVK